MVSKEQELLNKLNTEEKKAQDRLKLIAAKKKKVLAAKKQKARLITLKKKIAIAKSKGKKPLLTAEEKKVIKKGVKKSIKKIGFVTDVIAFGYSAAKKKGNKKQKRY